MSFATRRVRRLKSSGLFRAIVPEYYLTHPMVVLRSWVVITKSPIDAMNLAVIRPLFRADHILAIGGLFLDGRVSHEIALE
jgi:hypothetical protein